MASTQPRKVCFMVMPYGRRATHIAGAPGTVDFDALWHKVYHPALVKLGFEPVRADQDLGALIIKEMLERLVLAHGVVADISLPNANVYYEVGVRHAAKQAGCVLTTAAWSKPLFDLAQMPHLRYALDDGDVSDETAAALAAHFEARLGPLMAGSSPVFQSVSGYPEPSESDAASFLEFVGEMTRFQGRIKAVRGGAPSTRADAARALARDVLANAPILDSVALETLRLLRDCVTEDPAGWGEVAAFIGALDEATRELPLVREQLALAQSKSGDDQEAIAALLALIEQGPTSERYGLLGGRYKKLLRASTDERDRAHYLDQAIESYRQGSELDLNDYYPTCNLPRLYRRRAQDAVDEPARAADLREAQHAAVVALAAAQRARKRTPHDEWVRPTLLGAAFDAGDAEGAAQLAAEVRREGPAAWKLETTLEDLADAIALHPEEDVRAALQAIYDDLRKALPAR